MGEEVSTADYARGGGVDEDERVMAWEVGLPGADDLTPLSQSLIPPELASAFNIKPEPYRTAVDVNRASQTTLSSLRGHSSPPAGFKSFNDINSNNNNSILMVEDTDNDNDDDERLDSRKTRRIGGGGTTDTGMEEADSALNSNSAGGDDSSARTLKRPRLVWTPQLHKRFVDVVSHLGIKSAVPKTIMQMMNVEGLTRENVASHLQKYRLYLKRMQGLSNEGPSSSDQLFATTPVPPNLQESHGHGHGHGHGNSSNGHVGMPIPMTYGTPLMPMPMLGMGHHPGHGMPHGMGGYNGMEAHHPNAYGMMQQRDWSGNYNGSVFSYPHITSGEK